MTKRVIGASVLFGACLGCFTVAAAQVPREFMVDRYLLRVDRLMADGTFHQGSYVEGKKHGHWNVLAAGGNSQDGSYVEGKKHGRWTERQVDGSHQDGSYVAGRRHGRWRVQQTDGTNHEGPYVAGKRHGRWVIREHGRGMQVHFYVNGELVEKE